MNATQMAHPVSGELRTFKKNMFDCQMCIAASTERSVVASQEIPVGNVGMGWPGLLAPLSILSFRTL